MKSKKAGSSLAKTATATGDLVDMVKSAIMNMVVKFTGKSQGKGKVDNKYANEYATKYANKYAKKYAKKFQHSKNSGSFKNPEHSKNSKGFENSETSKNAQKSDDSDTSKYSENSEKSDTSWMSATAYRAKKLGASSIPFDDPFSFPFTLELEAAKEKMSEIQPQQLKTGNSAPTSAMTKAERIAAIEAALRKNLEISNVVNTLFMFDSKMKTRIDKEIGKLADKLQAKLKTGST